MTFKKHKPARDKAYLAWVHETLPGLCCICLDEPWRQLHHFGEDGAMGMKPSDYLVCRVCERCHTTYAVKGRRLYHETSNIDILNILKYMQRDALYLLEQYVVYQKAMLDAPVREIIIPHSEDVTPCATDELRMWWFSADWAAMDDPAKIDWLLRWADRRAAAIIDAYEDDDATN